MSLFRRANTLVVLTLIAGSLGGCGSINTFVADGMGDYIPAWAGGLPADAPPRPGTPKYDEWLRLHPQQGAAAQSGVAPSAAEAIH